MLHFGIRQQIIGNILVNGGDPGIQQMVWVETCRGDTDNGEKTFFLHGFVRLFLD
jgi:hypothetical protein